MKALVIGAGAAGLMAAGMAALGGAEVILLERNPEPGMKLKITGKGRCNITNNCTNEEFLREIPGDGRFFISALSRFSSADTIDFFTSLGIELVTERGRRVFPASGKAGEIVEALVNWVDSLGVVRRTGRAEKLLISDGAARGALLVDKSVINADAVCIATGGLSYPKTGSTGDGYTLARQAGHTVTELRPSLVPLASSDKYCAEMQGLSLRNVTLSLTDGGKTVWSEGPGEMLFTHFGVTGPLVLSASAHWKPGLHLSVDLKPGLSEEQLDSRIRRDLDKFGSRLFNNSLGDLLHKSMIPVIIGMCGFPEDRKSSEITKQERQKLGAVIKSFPIRISSTRSISEAVITRGGVSTKEINPRDMGSKLIKRLYFAGEVIDLDAYTGGYNLQIAWSTGAAAGKAIADCLKR